MNTKVNNSSDTREITQNVSTKLPLRSQLYNLAPIGVGTRHVESLTSYITRLAQAHSISVKDLLQADLLKGFIQSFSQNTRESQSSAWLRYSRAINGTRAWAKKCSDGFGKLTSRSDLHLLTMLPWASVIPTRGLLKKSKAWCPRCYEEWINDELPLYEPLLWKFDFIHICADHHVILERGCPHCHKEIPHLSSRSYPGHCSNCGKPLFDAIAEAREISSMRSPEIKWQLWMIDHIGELLAYAPNLIHPPNPEIICKLYRTQTDRHFDGTVTEMARLLGVTWIAVKTWITGKYIPKIENFLRSCYCFGVSPLQVLTVEELISEETIIRMPLWMEDNKRERPPRKLDKDWIRFEMEKVISAQYLFPPSMADVARSLQIDQSHLMRLFPEQCSLISKRYRKFRSISKKNRTDRLCERVLEIVQSLHKEGRYPGYDLVGSMLDSPSVLRESEINTTWKETLASLGYSEFDHQIRTTN